MNHRPKGVIRELILEAESVQDPIDVLFNQTYIDSGAAFAPEAVKALAELKRSDLGSFERTRSKLKKAGYRVAELDKAIAKEGNNDGTRSQKQADILIRIAASAHLFHTSDKTGFADISINGRRETWRIGSTGFRHWLSRRYYEETHGAANSEALQSALNTIGANAHFDGPERAVYVRVGGLNEKLYVDLCNESWQAVEVDAQGWRIVGEPPVRFRRADGMMPLPIPVQDGSINGLRPFLNLRSENDFVLVVAWALAVLRDRGPYPLIALSGEQGSAKSTFAAVLKRLLDPNTAPLRALPREIRELHIAATNGRVLAFDNLSDLPAWISDALCRLSTGGGFAVRKLYADQDEMLFNATRPVILNGIEEVITKSDLADRAIFINLEPIPEERRRSETQFWTDFKMAHPRILGGLLTTVAHGLAMLRQTHLERLPRMADFALWAAACETAFWLPGTFLAAYYSNRDEAVDSVLEADPVADVLRTFLAKNTQWTGTAKDLLGVLGELAGDAQRKSRNWPSSPRALSGRLRRASTFLRKVGVEIDFMRQGRARTRTIVICLSPENGGLRRSTSSAPSADECIDTAPAKHKGTIENEVVRRANDGGSGSNLEVPSGDIGQRQKAVDGVELERPKECAHVETNSVSWQGRI